MNQWSLEELVLQVIVQDSTDQQQYLQDDCTFAIRGLRLQGAKCRSNKLYLSSSISTELNLTLFKWIRATEKKQQINSMVTLPVYLNPTRSELLFTIELESADNSLNEFDYYERGVAVLASAIA
jgi:dynein heavy chain 1